MTRQAAPVAPPVVLTIAGSDSGGGAGIQADLKTIEAGEAFGTSAITSVTAQHTRGVESTHHLPVEEVAAQVEAVLGDFDVAAVKTGMLATEAVIERVREYAPDLPNLVVDPVMVAASGDRLLDREAEDAYEDLIGRATLVTPNADEAEVLTGVEVTDVDAARRAGEALLASGVDAALVKGGHVPGEDVVDVLVSGDGTTTFRHDRIEGAATHGSGCALSSAIATRLAHGDDLVDAVGEGVSLLSAAVRYGLDVGRGPGAVHHAVGVRREAAREETVRAVADLAGDLVGSEIRPAVPEGGTNVVGATPYAEVPGDVAGVDGGIVRTLDGVRRAGGVRFGAGGRVGRTLLAAREVDPGLRFATTLVDGDRVGAALADQAVAVETLPTDADEPLVERVAAALDAAGGDPVVVVDPRGDGPGHATILSKAPGELREVVRSLGGVADE